MGEKGKFAVLLVVAVLAMVALYGGILVYSSTSPPFSVIQSGSMQHSQDESAVGILDTGDMVLVRDPGKVHIQSYVEGYQSGYRAFGEYGNVIIYKKPNATPIIHRAMLWLDYNGDGTWTAEALENYPSELWSIAMGDWSSLRGTLTLYDVGYGKVDVSINLDYLPKKSGFLTKGDNAVTNIVFDQSGIIPYLIGMDDIKSVPAAELPWLGCVKMLMNKKNVENIPSNSVPSLVLFFVLLFSTIPVISVVYESVWRIRNPAEWIWSMNPHRGILSTWTPYHGNGEYVEPISTEEAPFVEDGNEEPVVADDEIEPAIEE